MSIRPKFKVGDRVINHCRKSRFDGAHYYGTNRQMEMSEKDKTVLIVTASGGGVSVTCKPIGHIGSGSVYHQDELKLYCSPVFVAEKEE